MESNNFGSTYTMDDIKKRVKNSFIIAFVLIFGGFIFAIVLAFSFAGEDGYIRDDAPGGWIFIALIPIILGLLMLFVPIISTIKLTKSNRTFINPEDLSPEEAMKDFQQMLIPLKKVKIFIIIIVMLFFGALFILTLLGELSWSEFFDAIF
ncbi:hypothetical protein DSAG12_03044 [Promethearchaeum syntrophicum]|uniref:Uncharacterized protein n=1 Tax=Promethearchaeum syntrophicum TaxID=2594042 RepID=A0A5B9DDP6_9ARCH|nr:hypothetical protein [Candidatus Prometheoarchaeum syntrophicum]QEE17212.1 hypothetical protein DSAG12_03044 [Candidatus Prometheoarchaeum syntrophicum]